MELLREFAEKAEMHLSLVKQMHPGAALHAGPEALNPINPKPQTPNPKP